MTMTPGWRGLWAALALLWACAVAAQPALHPVQVGGVTLTVPVPEGFEVPGTRVPALAQLGQRLAPPGNRHLAIFVAPADRERAQAGQDPGLSRYFLMQTLRQMEAQSLTTADFRQVPELMRGQYKTLLQQLDPQVQAQLERAASALSADSGQQLSLRAGQMVPLELFNDTDATVSLLALATYEITLNGQASRVPMVLGLTTAVRRGKLVYFYAYSRLQGDADKAWVRQATLDWSAALRALP